MRENLCFWSYQEIRRKSKGIAICLICVELNKQRMSIQEASRNINELRDSSQDFKELWHLHELEKALDSLDIKKLAELLEESDD